ncbi:MAG: TetR/AcrR family transcriptional regulator C-terminal domain-containing protein [Aristaeellaceae bacterium]
MKHEITSLNTKRTLAESLKKLMQHKPLSKITVSEIIADCGVNRKTFYYHFADIYALLKWMLESEAIEVVKHYDLLVDYQEALLFVMAYVEKNEHILSCVYDAMGREELKRFFYTDFSEIVLSIIDGAARECGTALTPEYRSFLCSFYTEALVGILIDWTKHHMERDRAQTIQNVVDTLRFSLLGIMRGYDSQRKQES